MSTITHKARVLLICGILSLGFSFVSGEVTSNATCQSGFSSLYNSKGQSPCLIAAFLGAQCNNGDFGVSGLSDGYFYAAPTGNQISLCECSSVYYSLISACASCQNSTYISWAGWTESCPDNVTSVAKYPLSIPSDTAIPAWAYQDVNSTGTFEITVADSNDSAESTASATPSSTIASHSSTTSASSNHPTSTSSSSTSPSSSSSTSSHTIAIAGGVVGGVVGVAAIGILAYMLGRRTRNRSNTSTSDSLKEIDNGGGQNVPLMSEKADFGGLGRSSPPQRLPYSNEPPRFYDPNDPSTFPVLPAANSLGLTNHPSPRPRPHDSSFGSVTNSPMSFAVPSPTYPPSSASGGTPRTLGYRGIPEV